MTGPEHYTNAETDLEHAAHASDKGRWNEMTYWLGCAQAHATLALAAATALHDPEGGAGYNDWKQWRKTASVNTFPPAPLP